MKKLWLLLLLGACSLPNLPPRQTVVDSRPLKDERLGTAWGETLPSELDTASGLQRTTGTPLEEIRLDYGSREPRGGLTLRSIPLQGGEVELRVLSNDRSWPTVQEGDHYYVQGRAGQRYRLHYRNNGNRSYEIVASVDGLNVITGRAARRQDSGYVLRPGRELTIEGFRRDRQSVAAFTFSSPGDSYAAHSDHGSIANSGVIGTVIYELQPPTPANSFPGDGFAPPPRR